MRRSLLRDLKRLRSGELNKIDLLATLRYSNEGKAKGVELDGLTVPALVRRLGQLPVIGYFIRLAIAFIRLPNQVRDQREFAGYVLSQQQQIADFVNAVSVRTAECVERVSRVEQALSKQSTTLDELRDELRVEHEGLEKRQHDHTALLETFKTIEPRIETRLATEKELMQSRIEDVRGQTEQLQALIEELQREPDFHYLDALYAALEDRFRGSREEIKDRFRVYLPYVEAAREKGDVVDLGCGRGEWLELLNDAGIKARGVEKNRVLIELCRERRSRSYRRRHDRAPAQPPGRKHRRSHRFSHHRTRARRRAGQSA